MTPEQALQAFYEGKAVMHGGVRGLVVEVAGHCRQDGSVDYMFVGKFGDLRKAVEAADLTFAGEIKIRCPICGSSKVRLASQSNAEPIDWDGITVMREGIPTAQFTCESECRIQVRGWPQLTALGRMIGLDPTAKETP